MNNLRQNATELTNSREDILIRYLGGDILTGDDVSRFACTEDDLIQLYQALHAKEPTLSSCSKAGGLGNHRDFDIHVASGTKGVEVKTSEKKVNKDLLTWQPWEGGVEFAQGQIRSKLMNTFLGDCGTPMIASWHQKLITNFLPTHFPQLTVPTLDDYTKVIFTIGGEPDTPAGNLIQALRTNGSKREILQQMWLEFEDEWFASHQPDKDAFERVLKQILEEKDYWINISKSGAYLIEGFFVKGLRYLGTAKKKNGGTVFRYSMALQKKSGGEVKEVPFVLKFYWKNGGQAVKNINILMVSDSFA